MTSRPDAPAPATIWRRPVPTVGDPSSAHERAGDPSGWAFPPEAIADSTLPAIGFQVGGLTLQAVLTAAGFAATLASLLASHASVARMLLVMGRNGVLPRKIFGYISPRTHTPAFTIVLVGIINLAAIAFTLDQIVDYITTAP